jgi:hypothetical protein
LLRNPEAKKLLPQKEAASSRRLERDEKWIQGDPTINQAWTETDGQKRMTMVRKPRNFVFNTELMTEHGKVVRKRLSPDAENECN